MQVFLAEEQIPLSSSVSTAVKKKTLLLGFAWSLMKPVTAAAGK